MGAYRSVRRLNKYYKSNDGFKAWVKANEQWFRENPDVFKQMLRNPSMVNLFMDQMVQHSPRIERRLSRLRKKRK
ncbi:MAG: hypothetical protein K0R47_1450 [Brevibacillus sp.]|nr:hypothetical protein [Brevibacillus sp.]